MPSDWPRCLLEDVAASQQGSIAIGPFGSRLKTDLYTEHGVALIRGTNLAGSKFFAGEFVYVSAETARGLGNANVKPWDLVFPHRGNIGAVGLVPEGSQRYALSTSLMKVTIDRKRADPLFLYYFFRSPQGQAELLKNASQVGTPGIATPLTSLRACVVPVPPIEEQVPAAQLLSLLDDRIDLLRQTNATLESIAQTLFKSWFIDFDPVRAKAEGREPLGLDAATAALFPAEFEESTPAGWRMGTLETLCSQGGGLIQTGPFGSQLHASDYEDQGLPVVMPQDLDGRRISTDRVARVSVAHVERLARHKLQPGDVVFSRRGDVGRHAAVTEVEAGWLCGTGCLLVRPGPRWPSPAYVSQALATPEATDWLKRHAVGATMPNLNTGILGALPMLLPSDAVLTAFESVCGALEARITKNRAQALALSELRDTLLPRLISGKLRLPEAQERLADALA